MYKRCQSTAELCNIDNGGCIRYYVHLIKNIQGVSGGIVNILGGGSMDYSK